MKINEKRKKLILNAFSDINIDQDDESILIRFSWEPEEGDACVS